MQPETPKLKYLFVADFADGTSIVQEPEDRSLIDPEKRSRFYDVLQEIEKGNPLIRFDLINQELDAGIQHTYSVDLVDGHFEVDGLPFRMHEEEVVGFEIIFFRQHTHSFHVGKEKNEETSHDIVYRMGWKKTGDQTYQRVMQIK